jgi:hypothetical protein
MQIEELKQLLINEDSNIETIRKTPFCNEWYFYIKDVNKRNETITKLRNIFNVPNDKKADRHFQTWTQIYGELNFKKFEQKGLK